ncbi:hypothetical protein GE09DRAFT_593291 [Coniochaeta sp. 2T2.1]|nr:hypothetical protein GE09DRAFT_593291 [Coniochaeta sp. 2T2.1]
MSATRAFALRSTLRAACRRPIQAQALSRRGYASVQGAAHQAAHKAGSDLPWLATSAVISLPTLAYLLYNGPEKKSHAEHQAEASDEHGVKHAKPDSEIGEAHEPIPTSHTDTGDAESKGHVVGYKPEDHSGGHEDSEEGAQPQDNVAADKAKKEKHEGEEKHDEADKKSTDEGKEGGSGAEKKGKGEMDDDKGSQEKKLTDKPDSKRVDPTEKK